MPRRPRVPERGDIYRVRLNPADGREMQGDMRPVLVLTPAAFNMHNPPMVAPITQGGDYTRVQGFATPLLGVGTKTQGAVIVSQVRTMDLAARQGAYVETAPDAVITDALSRLLGILEPA